MLFGEEIIFDSKRETYFSFPKSRSEKGKIMKKKIFGIVTSIIAVALVTGGTVLFAVSAQNERKNELIITEVTEEADDVEEKIYSGNYYKNGDVDAEKIILSENEIVYSDGTKEECFLSVWKDMPETDEQSGEITYKNYCFVRVGKEKYSYDPALGELLVDGNVYKLV